MGVVERSAARGWSNVCELVQPVWIRDRIGTYVTKLSSSAETRQKGKRECFVGGAVNAAGQTKLTSRCEALASKLCTSYNPKISNESPSQYISHTTLINISGLKIGTCRKDRCWVVVLTEPNKTKHRRFSSFIRNSSTMYVSYVSNYVNYVLSAPRHRSSCWCSHRSF
jgi:hypothetical protein